MAEKKALPIIGVFDRTKFFYMLAVFLLVVLVGYLLTGIGALVGGVSGVWLLATGGALVLLAKFFIASDLALYGLGGEEPDYVRAGVWVAAGLMLMSL